MNNEVLEFDVSTGSSLSSARPRQAATCPQMFLSHPATTSVAVLYLSGDTADWVLEATKKLEAIGNLRPDWDSHRGLALNPGAKKLTLRVLDWLREDDLPTPAVVLGSAGNVQLEWRARGGRELEVNLGNGDGIEFLKVAPCGEMEEGAEKQNLSGTLRGLAHWLMRG